MEKFKKLKFTSNLIPLILSREKIATWRLFDDKNLQAGDKVEFLNAQTEEGFAEVTLSNVFETTLGNLTEEDKEGHEKYKSDDDMYKVFRKYYGDNVCPDTKVKIIKFKLL